MTDKQGIVFVATDLTEGDTGFEDTEAIIVKNFVLSQHWRWCWMVLSDAISIAGLLRLADSGIYPIITDSLIHLVSSEVQDMLGNTE